MGTIRVNVKKPHESNFHLRIAFELQNLLQIVSVDENGALTTT